MNWRRIRIGICALVVFAAWYYIGPTCGILVVSAIVGFYLLVIWSQHHEAQIRAMLERKGQLVKAWIVFANEQLYRVNNPKSMLPAQVVFTPDRDVKNLNDFLSDLADVLRSFKTDDPADDDERIIGQIVRTQIGYYRPLRVPDRLTGGIEAYTVSISVPCELLRTGQLEKPYVFCRVLVDADSRHHRLARMTAFPRKKTNRPHGPLTWEEKESAEET
jgi:hypothetical protein